MPPHTSTTYYRTRWSWGLTPYDWSEGTLEPKSNGPVGFIFYQLGPLGEGVKKNPIDKLFDSPQIFLTAIIIIFFFDKSCNPSNFYRFYYPHGSRELVSPVCGIFYHRISKALVGPWSWRHPVRKSLTL